MVNPLVYVEYNLDGVVATDVDLNTQCDWWTRVPLAWCIR